MRLFKNLSCNGSCEHERRLSAVSCVCAKPAFSSFNKHVCAGSQRFAVASLQAAITQSKLPEGPEAEMSQEHLVNNREDGPTLWQSCAQKGTLHALTLRQLAEARQKDEGRQTGISALIAPERLSPAGRRAGEGCLHSSQEAYIPFRTLMLLSSLTLA